MLDPVRLLTLHGALYHLAMAMAGGFVGAYLLKLGLGLPAALLAFAALLTLRFGLRFAAVAVVRRLGYRVAVATGAGIASLQFLPLLKAEDPAWLGAWLLVASVAEALYWPVYHAAAASLGSDAARGRELGARAAVGAVVGIVGPLAGGFLLERGGPAVDFSIASAVMLLSAAPLAALGRIPAGPVPSGRELLRVVDGRGLFIFALDGWMASGLAVAWPMALFLALGSGYEGFGIANAGAGLVGAATGWLCGRAIDRGRRERWAAGVAAALAAGFALRAAASWSPVAATVAAATGAAVAGFYGPLLMSAIYARAKGSGAAYRFHLAAEAGWDAGAVGGLLLAAATAAVTGVPSLAVLPAALALPPLAASLAGRPGFGSRVRGLARLRRRAPDGRGADPGPLPLSP